MIKKKSKLIQILIISIFNLSLSYAKASQEVQKVINIEQDQGVMQSPYFIDDLHCSGLQYDDSSKSYVDNNKIDDHEKLILQEVCYQVYNSYEIKKYDWVSPEDLENFLIKIKNSDAFETVNMNIKKSELKNHIHVYISVSYKKPNLHIKSESTTQKINGKTITDLDIEVNYKKMTFLNQKQEWGFKKSTLSDAFVDVNNNKIAQLSEIKQQATTAYFEMNSMASLDSRLRMNIIGRDLYWSPTDHHSKVDFEIDGDILKKSTFGLAGYSYFGLAYHYFNSETPTQFSNSLNENSSNQNSESLLAPGLKFGFNYGLPNKNNFNIEVVALKPITTVDAYIKKVKFDLGFAFEDRILLLDTWSIYSNIEESKNYNSALNRSLLNHYSKGNYGILAHKDIKNAKGIDRLSYGLEQTFINVRNSQLSESATNKYLKPITHDFLKLNYRTQVAEWNLDLGFRFEI